MKKTPLIFLIISCIALKLNANNDAQKQLIEFVQFEHITYKEAYDKIKNLKQQQADINKGFLDKEQPLVLAIKANNPAMVKALWDHGALLRVQCRGNQIAASRIAANVENSGGIIQLLLNLMLLEKISQKKLLTPKECSMRDNLLKENNSLVL